MIAPTSTCERWMEAARCKGMTATGFFPTDGAGVVVAKRVCARCLVASDCLEYALLHNLDHGVWGGKSERERRKLAIERRLTVAGGDPST